jgi:hypothetical protein
MRQTQSRRRPRSRATRDFFLYDLSAMIDNEFDDSEVMDRTYVREFTGKFKEVDDRD